MGTKVLAGAVVVVFSVVKTSEQGVAIRFDEETTEEEDVDDEVDDDPVLPMLCML
jgi:hypothetical protein